MSSSTGVHMRSVKAKKLEDDTGAALQYQPTDSKEQKVVDTPASYITHPLAINALVAFPLVVWLLSVLAGVFLHQDVSLRPKHVLDWFDRGIFRPAGSLLPLCILLPRVLIGKVSGKQPTYLLKALFYYAVIISVRVLIYAGHLLVQPRYQRNIVSDHIVLGASIIACLQLELVCAVNDSIKQMEADTALPLQLASCTNIIAATVLILCISFDMFFTARYYHAFDESVRALLIGLLFQLPVAWLLAKKTQTTQRA